MNTPLQTLVYKLLIYAIILIAGIALGAVNLTSEHGFGLVLPCMLTVLALNNIYQYIKAIRKTKDKSKIEFK